MLRGVAWLCRTDGVRRSCRCLGALVTAVVVVGSYVGLIKSRSAAVSVAGPSVVSASKRHSAGRNGTRRVARSRASMVGIGRAS